MRIKVTPRHSYLTPYKLKMLWRADHFTLDFWREGECREVIKYCHEVMDKIQQSNLGDKICSDSFFIIVSEKTVQHFS